MDSKKNSTNESEDERSNDQRRGGALSIGEGKIRFDRLVEKGQ